MVPTIPINVCEKVMRLTKMKPTTPQDVSDFAAELQSLLSDLHQPRETLPKSLGESSSIKDKQSVVISSVRAELKKIEQLARTFRTKLSSLSSEAQAALLMMRISNMISQGHQCSKDDIFACRIDPLVEEVHWLELHAGGTRSFLSLYNRSGGAPSKKEMRDRHGPFYRFVCGFVLAIEKRGGITSTTPRSGKLIMALEELATYLPRGSDPGFLQNDWSIAGISRLDRVKRSVSKSKRNSKRTDASRPDIDKNSA